MSAKKKRGLNKGTIRLSPLRKAELRKWINETFDSEEDFALKVAASKYREPKEGGIRSVEKHIERLLATKGDKLNKRNGFTRKELKHWINATFDPGPPDPAEHRRRSQELVCRLQACSKEKEVRLSGRQFEKGYVEAVKSLQDEWGKAQRLILVQVNGQIYRDQRVWFQRQKKEKKDKAYRSASKVKNNEPLPLMKSRIDAEVSGSEMFDLNKLTELWVFIPCEHQFESWKRANNLKKHEYESHRALKHFWINHLEKIQRDDVKFQETHPDKFPPLDVQLFEYTTTGLTGYFFDWGLPSAFFFGAPQLFGRDIRPPRRFSAHDKGQGNDGFSYFDIEQALSSLKKVSANVDLLEYDL